MDIEAEAEKLIKYCREPPKDNPDEGKFNMLLFD